MNCTIGASTRARTSEPYLTICVYWRNSRGADGIVAAAVEVEEERVVLLGQAVVHRLVAAVRARCRGARSS